MKKYFITGISGFVGRYLHKKLASLPEAEVYGVDREMAKANQTEYFQSCDITDAASLQTIISRIKPDYVIHLAGQSSIKTSFTQPELTFKVNVGGTRNLLQACQMVSPKKILMVSSAEVYGSPQYLPIDEKHPLQAGNPYAESRIEQEKLRDDYPELPIIIARAFNHTGPGQPPQFVLPAFALQMARIKKGLQAAELLVGEIEVKRDFTDVRDIIEGYKMLLDLKTSYDIYNIGSGQSYKLTEVIEKLSQIAGIKPKIKIDPDRLREHNIPELRCDYRKLKKATGWQPTINLASTLEDMFHYFYNLS